MILSFPLIYVRVLTEEMRVQLQLYDGRALSASVPKHVTCTIQETQLPMKGLTSAPRYVFSLRSGKLFTFFRRYMSLYISLILTIVFLKNGEWNCSYKRALLDNGSTIQVKSHFPLEVTAIQVLLPWIFLVIKKLVWLQFHWFLRYHLIWRQVKRLW